MADIKGGFADGIRKAFLAGVGAVAYGAEKGTELVEDLVKKGELTVEQGKDLNRELTQKAKAAAGEAQDTVLRARMVAMTAEERADFVDRARKIASDLDAEAAASHETVDVEVEVVDEGDEDGE